ncbi:MAG: translation initiation factor IF-3 [Candidatus Shikimatogenerans sp. JK-2022]|nr:translation initiation factor IF-3 [Candidatus Shikimatogenerans bostrichidophilus]
MKYKLVKLVGSDLFENKIYKINDLLNKLKKLNKKLDLMILNDKIFPPIVKILNFNKFLYKIKKKYKKNIKNKLLKIIRLSPQINEHDLKFKIKQAKKFLLKKYKIKFYVFFKGRSIIYKKQGVKVLNNCSILLKKYGEIEKLPYMEFNKMYMIIKPFNKKNEKKN